MDNVKFEDYTIRVVEAMDEAVIASLHEIAGEIEARTKRNSRQGHKYGDIQATALWEHQVDEGEMKAMVGSRHEAGYWEEFGTGEHALNGDGRKGWWVYVEGQDSGKGGKTYSSREEAMETVAYLKEVKGLEAHATDGMEPNRPLFRAFNSAKSVAQAIVDSKLKGMG